ncbi:MAG: hypothetical protein ACREXW_19275 [Gammaproteobacteria bacterium]
MAVVQEIESRETEVPASWYEPTAHLLMSLCLTVDGSLFYHQIW